MEVDVGRSTYATVLLIDSESYIRYLCRNPENCPLSRRYNKTLVITGNAHRFYARSQLFAALTFAETTVVQNAFASDRGFPLYKTRLIHFQKIHTFFCMHAIQLLA